ncbi:MAG TPA: SpoIIE family protein phosphatase [Candidatus Krumholzibacteriaceae bacterium]|nr:SpoIIE family protein phosphatase [Candidatus Krumholzibacteriaceae bacterium]
MIRFIRSGIIAAALLIIILGYFGLEDFLESPFLGIKDHNLKIIEVEEDGPNFNSSIKIGDLIVAVNGIRVNNMNHYKYLIFRNTNLTPFIFTVKRNGELIDIKVRVEKQPIEKKLKRFGLIISALSFITAGFVVIQKRSDIMGILFSMNCLVMAFIFTDRPIVSLDILNIGGELIYDLLFIFMPAFFLHFFLMFPGRVIETGSTRYKAEKYLYYPPTIIYAISFILSLANYNSTVSRSVIHVHETIISLYWMFYAILIPVIFIRSYRASTKALKTKFRIVIFGIATGILPMALMLFIMHIKPISVSHNYLYLSWISLSFISITFSWAILKQDAFNLRLALKRVIVYLVIPLLFTAFYYVINQISKSNTAQLLDLNQYYFSAIAIIFFAVLFVPARSMVFSIFDRYSYQERGYLKRSLMEFSHNIRSHKSTEGIISCVTKEIVTIFKPESVQVFLSRDDFNFELSYIYPEDKEIAVKKLPKKIELLRETEKKKSPLMLEYFDSMWVKYKFDRISREFVNINKNSTIVAISVDAVLKGFIIAGPKKSGGIYTSEDSELLNFLGERTAASLRNLELSRINLEKEELENEIRIASGIQKKLLPDSPPTLQGAQIAAKIRTSKQVGGDFYDFFDLGAGITGLAVSDVAGKGIPAAFLMSTIQASLSAQTQLKRRCADVVYYLNNSLFEKSDSIRHATLFYALYDEQTGIVNYTNAGAEPPVIIKRNGKIERLKRGGLVLGIEKDAPYLEGAVKLQSGDLLTAFTDGVIDQEDDEGNYFGCERFLGFLVENYELSPDRLIDKLFDSLEDFGNKKIKDDTTVIILKKD